MALYKLYSENGRFKVIRFSPLNTFEGLIENVTFELSNISTNTVKIIGLNDSGFFTTARLISDFEDVTGVVWEYEKLNRWIQLTKVGQKAQAVLELIASNISVDPYGVFTSTQLQGALQELSDAIGGGGSNIYNTDGVLTANRVVDLLTYYLSINTPTGDLVRFYPDKTARFFGQVGFNGAGTSPSIGVISNGDTAGQFNGTTYGVKGTGVIGGEFSGSGGINASGTTYGILSESSLGVAVKSNGSTLVEEYGLGSSIHPSALLQANSTSKGFLPPRMTTAQINAISSPSDGLVVYNTDRKRLETYKGSYWAGEAMTYFVQSTSSSPADGGTFYFGTLPKGIITTANISKVYIKKSGVIRMADIYCYSGTAGTAENWSLYIRVNNTTDYLIETIGSATNERIFNNNALNIPVIAGDYFEIKGINPTWATNPLTTIFGGNVIVE